MLKKIAIALAVIIAMLLVVVALQPADFRIARSVDIAAPSPVVFRLLNDLRVWNNWSPWAKLDPNMKTTFSGAAAGTGAIYEWSGNDQVGSGRMEITGVRDNAEITIKLDFITPFKASNTTTFTLAPRGPGVTLTWAMTGRNDFMGKAFGLVMNMDKMVGADFEKGLADLKQLAEAKANPAP